MADAVVESSEDLNDLRKATLHWVRIIALRCKHVEDLHLRVSAAKRFLSCSGSSKVNSCPFSHGRSRALAIEATLMDSLRSRFRKN